VLTLSSSYPLGNLDTIIWSPFDQISCNDPFCASVTVAPQDAMTVTALVESGPCSASAQIQLLVRKVRTVFIPNIFSPNFDGINDVFYIQTGPQVREVRQFLVFDRWGEPVFQARNFPPNATAFGWDGTNKGKRAHAGVYAWFAEIEYLDGHVETLKGDVTLVR
jgi:gliding motility-associated-like protein